MKQDNHMDLDAILRDLPAVANEAMKDLQATPFLKARIDRAISEKKQSKVRFTLPRWAPAMCCAAVVLVLTLVFVPMGSSTPDNLINSAMLGDPTQAPASVLSADLGDGNVTISTNTSKPGYRNMWASVQDGSFPLIGVNGKYYRMMTSPKSVSSSLLDGQVATISEFTPEPSLSGTDVVLSNTAEAGTAVYSIRGVNASTFIAAEVDGRVRLVQRVSYNGNALRGSERLADTLAVSGKVVALELSGVGTVTDADACAALMSTLLGNAGYQSSGSLSSRQALLIELDNGLVLQLAVKGDRFAACGVWSCPEFFEDFETYCE